MGQALEGKICAQYGGEELDQVEWGEPQILNLGGS
jgi:hypothetical protein